MKPQRPKVEPIRQPTLFQMEKLEEAATPSTLAMDRPYSLPGILLGTSSFTADGWAGSVYPRGMKSADYLSYYAAKFATVEIDSTFYGCPSARTVSNWAARTPEDFTFGAPCSVSFCHCLALGISGVVAVNRTNDCTIPSPRVSWSNASVKETSFRFSIRTPR